MAWQVLSGADGRIVETVYTGKVSPAELAESVTATLAAANEQATARFLVDSSAMQGGHTLTDLYTQIEAALRHPLAAPVTEAIVLAPQAPPAVVENVEFWAASLRTRGMNVQIFLDRGKALAWLKDV